MNRSEGFQHFDLHCFIKCPQNLQAKTLLQTYTAFICRIYNEILLKVFDPRNRSNLILKLQFFVLTLFVNESILDINYLDLLTPDY